MRLRLVFFGSPEFAVPSLQALCSQHEVVAVVTQPDKPAGRGKKVAPPPVKEVATTLGLPVLQPAGVRSPEVIHQLESLQADLFVVVAYGRILPPALLALPRLGPWNVHASLLPQLRGAAPIQWGIIRGDEVAGVTIMRMEAGLDTGPSAAQATMPIRQDDTAGTLAPRLAELGAQLLMETLPRIADGGVVLTTQDSARATLAPPLKKEDGRLDFRLSAHEVSARARGVDPWPGASALLNKEPIKLFLPRVNAGNGEPGEILGLVNDGLLVACGRDAVAFAEIQLPGRRRLPAAAVLAGRPMTPGTRLGADV